MAGSLTFDKDIADIPEGSAERTEFENTFKDSLVDSLSDTGLGIGADDIEAPQKNRKAKRRKDDIETPQSTRPRFHTALESDGSIDQSDSLQGWSQAQVPSGPCNASSNPKER